MKPGAEVISVSSHEASQVLAAVGREWKRRAHLASFMFRFVLGCSAPGGCEGKKQSGVGDGHATTCIVTGGCSCVD